MATEERGSRGGHGRTRAGLAGVFVVVAAAAVFAFPAGAVAAPTGAPSIVAVAAPAAMSSGASFPANRAAGGGSGLHGDINVTMLAIVASLGLAFGVPLAGRARIARWRCVRRFRLQLRNVDTVGVCFEEINRR